MRAEQKLSKILLNKGQTIALAESCTGGLLANRFTNIPGSSLFFWLGIIAYDNKAKVNLLKISPNIIKKHGAVSLPVAKLMAQNVRKILNTDFGIGITGIAGPTGGSKNKPVGLVFIALANKQKTILSQCHFKGSRISIKTQAVNKALEMLIKAVS